MTAPTPEPAPRPEPVLVAAKQAGYIAGLIGTVATALGAFGAISGQHWAVDTAAVVTAIATGLAGVLPRITAQGARAQVTPLAAPESVDGTPLVPSANVATFVTGPGVSGTLPVSKVSGADVSQNMGPDAA